MYAVALYYMHYNIVRIHKSLRITPAIAAVLLSIFGRLRIL